ncbi:hypothetical protein B0H14DRAFT_3496643 [Mycena olivaceomarginata]|nr:hypothetical protein B0H14DRAFT_3496643 [Mycena olivaceomarginata]
MVDKHNAATKKAQAEAIKLLKDPLLIGQIKALEPFITKADALVTKFSAVHSKLNTLKVLIHFAIRMMADSPISAAFKDLQQCLQVGNPRSVRLSGHFSGYFSGFRSGLRSGYPTG